MEDMEDMGGSWVRTGVHACLPISAAAVSRDVREIDVNNLVDILDVIRTIMYHILHYPVIIAFSRTASRSSGRRGSAQGRFLACSGVVHAWQPSSG